MQTILERANAFFELRLTLPSRILVAAAGLLLLGTLVLPLYTMTLYSNQFPEGLVLNIHATRLEGGKSPNRDDLKEINSLNHYIGMRELKEEDFTEFKWIPFVIGGVILLALRVAVLGSMSRLVDLLVLFTYFGLFSLWSFYRKLYLYGHELDPTAAVKVPPFTPPIFGHQTMANFEVYNYPDTGSWLMMLVPVLLLAAIWLSWRRARTAS
jgi:hypothetical protein